jgi:hypothetical protein
VSRPSRQRRCGLRGDRRGAVYVEFLGAFFPIFFAFWCLMQSAGLYSAKLITRHSAYLGARAAAVVIPDDPQKYDSQPGAVTGKRKSAIEDAVKMGLAANRSLMNVLAVVEIQGGNGKSKDNFGRDEKVTVKVHVPYRCTLPIADKVVCGFAGMTLVEGEASMVVNGADYVYP